MNLQQAFITAFGEFLEAFGQEHGVIVGLRHPKYIMEALIAREIDAEAVSFIPVFQARPAEPPPVTEDVSAPPETTPAPENLMSLIGEQERLRLALEEITVKRERLENQAIDEMPASHIEALPHSENGHKIAEEG